LNLDLSQKEVSGRTLFESILKLVRALAVDVVGDWVSNEVDEEVIHFLE
jgi:hypothetical protein